MRRSPHRLLSVAGLVLLCGAALLAPERAVACGNSIEEEGNAIVGILLSADKMLRQGKQKEAVQAVLQPFPSLRTTPIKNRLFHRAQRIVAVAVVRTNGLLPVNGFIASTSEERRKSLEWALQVLREANEREPGNPVIEASLGEALARLPEHMAEAVHLLDRLAQRDVLPSAQGYRALAQLRRLAGDVEQERAALEKAAALAKSPPPPEPAPFVAPFKPPTFRPPGARIR